MSKIGGYQIIDLSEYGHFKVGDTNVSASKEIVSALRSFDKPVLITGFVGESENVEYPVSGYAFHGVNAGTHEQYVVGSGAVLILIPIGDTQIKVHFAVE